LFGFVAPGAEESVPAGGWGVWVSWRDVGLVGGAGARSLLRMGLRWRCVVVLVPKAVQGAAVLH